MPSCADLEQPLWWQRLPPPCAMQAPVERLDLDIDARWQTPFSTWMLRGPHVPPAEGGVDASESGDSEEVDWGICGCDGTFPPHLSTVGTTQMTASPFGVRTSAADLNVGDLFTQLCDANMWL